MSSYKPWVPKGPEPSARELQVLNLISLGMSNKEIGAVLYVTEDTVKTHARHMFVRLGARDRCHAVRVGFERHLLVSHEPDPEPIELPDLELRVLDLVSQGMTNKMISQRVYQSVDRVKYRVAEVCRLLGARDRVHAVRKGFEHDLLRRPAGGGS